MEVIVVLNGVEMRQHDIYLQIRVGLRNIQRVVIIY